ARAAYEQAEITRGELAGAIGEHGIERHGAGVVARAVAEAHGATFRFTSADDEHVRDLPDLRVTDAVAELLVAVVELGADARGAQTRVHRARVLDVLLADRQHTSLNRRAPPRERPG